MIRRMLPTRTLAPAEVLLTLAEAKAHCRVDFDDDDDLIEAFVAAAAARLDGRTGIVGRALITQTWACSWSGFPAERLRLPIGPVQSVTSLKYQDADDVEQTLSASLYRLHADAEGPYIALKAGTSWPSTAERDDAVTATWVAGYGDAASDVPAPIVQAAKLLTAHFYEQREIVAVGAVASSIQTTVDALIAPFRVRQVL